MKLKLPYDEEKLGLRTPEQKKKFRRGMVASLVVGILIGANIVASGYGMYFFGIACLVMVVFEIWSQVLIAKEFDGE